MIDDRKKYKIQGSDAYPHIGALLESYFKSKKINKAEVARKLGVHRGGIDNYFLQESLQLGILWKIGVVLKHNFLAEVIEQFPVKFVTENDRQRDALLAEKEDKIQKLEAELEVYKRIVGK